MLTKLEVARFVSITLGMSKCSFPGIFAETVVLCAQVRDNLGVLRGACEQLMGCGDFMVLLQAVLSLGNHLNEGTMRGAASGQTRSLPISVFLYALHTPLTETKFYLMALSTTQWPHFFLGIILAPRCSSPFGVQYKRQGPKISNNELHEMGLSR